MKTRFKKNAKIFDIVITALAGVVSVGVMLYAVLHFGLQEAWPELVLNLFYIACLVMIGMYFFDRLDTPLYDLENKQLMIFDEFDIHPEKESQRKILDWDRTYFLTKYYCI